MKTGKALTRRSAPSMMYEEVRSSKDPRDHVEDG